MSGGAFPHAHAGHPPSCHSGIPGLTLTRMTTEQQPVTDSSRPADSREGMGAVIWLVLGVVAIVFLVFAVNYFLA
jgi:hypothetical protein